MNIETLYAQYLKFSYGDKEMMVRCLNKEIVKYQTCEGKDNPKVIQRVKDYQSMIQMAS